MKMIHEGTRVWRGAELAFFGPANSCPSALCQNMLGVHLACCPGVSAPGWSCGCLHDNSRSGVNCCAWSQMLLCTCGLIRRCSLPPSALPCPSQRTHYILSLPSLLPSNPPPRILSLSGSPPGLPLPQKCSCCLICGRIIHAKSIGVSARTQARGWELEMQREVRYHRALEEATV